MRPEQTIAFARALLAQGALSDADRELMEKALNALVVVRNACSTNPHMQGRVYVGIGVQANNAIAALRTRLLRHSEGKAASNNESSA